MFNFASTNLFISKTTNDMATNDTNEPLPVRMLKAPIKESPSVYRLETLLYVKKECGWVCPKCNEPIVITPLVAGTQYFTCEKCNAKTYAEVRPEEEFITFLPKKKPQPKADIPQQPKQKPQPVTPQGPAIGISLDIPEDINNQQPGPHPPVYPNPPIPPFPPVSNGKKTVVASKPQKTNAVLQWGRGGFFCSKKEFAIKTGENIVGREDPGTPSDLQFSDPQMSRRSVCIEATPNQGSFSYTLRVLKALNPVIVNGQAFTVGAYIKLVDNTVITLGQTVLTFKTK